MLFLRHDPRSAGMLRTRFRIAPPPRVQPSELPINSVASKNSSRNPARDYCILLLMFRHGLRVSELCSMKLSDINVDTKEFHVTRLKGCDSGPHELYNGRVTAIKAWLIERAKMDPPETCDTLFISERRKPLSRCTVWLMIGQIAREAGLEHLEIHPHMLRHSCGYALA